MALTRGRKVLIGIAVVVLALLGWSGFTRDARNRVAVQTEKVGRRDLVSVVSASGEIRPRRFVNVSANVSGRITQLKVKEGEPVREGQVLARIDSARFEAGTRQSEAAVQSARAELTRAQADLEVTRLAFERSARMHEEKLVSDQQYDQANAEQQMKTAAVEAQRKRIAQLEAAAASNQDDLDKTVVLAPMDGVVTSLAKEEGEVVIGAQSFQPTVIMTVGDLSIMEVEVLVDETDIRNLVLGQPAEVRVDALEGVKIRGSVTEIGSSAIPRGGTAGTTAGSSANQAKDFKVTVTLVEPPSSLRPGLNATADITTARRPDVLAVPIQAVVVRELDKSGAVIEREDERRNPGEVAETPRAKGEEREGVFVVTEREAHFRPVKTGIVGETEIEVLEGVKEGEELVTGSYKTLRTLKDKTRIKLEEQKHGGRS